jgi:hypothetical protein
MQIKYFFYFLLVICRTADLLVKLAVFPHGNSGEPRKKIFVVCLIPNRVLIHMPKNNQSPTTSRIVNAKTYLAMLCCLTLCACNREPAPGPEIHDTKYRAVNQSGEVQDASVAPGRCAKDTWTELTWEVKTDQPGLHASTNTYTWYDPEESWEGELDYRGVADGGECTGSACDTAGFIVEVNQAGLCGFSDWRMPARDELGSISDPRITETPPTINTRHFPLTQPGEYWSGNDYQFQYDTAWVWSFHNGLDRVEWKSSPRFVRLVRGEPRKVTRVKD